MKSRKKHAFETVFARCEQRAAKLHTEQTLQRIERDAAAAELAQSEAHAQAKLDSAHRYAARVDAMTCGYMPFSIGHYAACRRYRDALLEEHASANVQCTQLRAALQAKADRLATTTRQIARNDARLGILRTWIQRLAHTADAIARDAQDEEIEEGVLARQLAARRKSNEVLG